MGYIHQDCLTHWLSIKRGSHPSSSSSPSTLHAQCEICHHPFTFTSEVRRSAPSSPGWVDAAAGLWEGVRDVGLTLLQLMSWRHLSALLLIPLCPHLSHHPSLPLPPPLSLTPLLSLLSSTLLSLLLLSGLSLLSTFVLLSSLHGFTTLWSHELHILVHLMRKRLRTFSRRQRRARRGVRGAVDDRGGEGEGGGGEGEGEEWLDRMVEGINSLSAIDSMGELLHLVYHCHLLVSTCAFVLPYLSMRALGWTLTLLPPLLPLPTPLTSLSSLSYFVLSSLISIFNGGLPLLLPSSLLTYLASPMPPSPFELSSLLIHFTPTTLHHLHALLHLSPLLHLLTFYSLLCLLLLSLPLLHPLHVMVRTSLSVLLNATLLLCVEFLLTPFIMGLIVHTLTLPLFLSPSPSPALSHLFLSHLLYFLSHPFTSSLLHWLLGTSFFILSTSLFRLLISSTRRRVIARVFTVDHRTDLIHDVISSSLLREAYRRARSFLIYTSLCVSVVGGPVGVWWALVGGLGAPQLGLPLRWGMGGVMSWIIGAAVVALFVWKVWVGDKQARRERRRTGKRRMEEWMGRVGGWYGLKGYLVKPQQEKERELEERKERRRGMRARRLMMEEEEQEGEGEDPFPFIDDPPADDDVDSNDDTEDEVEHWMHNAELDHLLIEAEEDRHHDAVEGGQEEEEEEEEGEEGEEEGDGLNAALLPHVHQEWRGTLVATVARKQRDRLEKEEEAAERRSTPLFWLRLLATVLTLWALAVLFLIPSFLLCLHLGRLLLYPVPLASIQSQRPLRPHGRLHPPLSSAPPLHPPVPPHPHRSPDRRQSRPPHPLLRCRLPPLHRPPHPAPPPPPLPPLPRPAASVVPRPGVGHRLRRVSLPRMRHAGPAAARGGWWGWGCRGTHPALPRSPSSPPSPSGKRTSSTSSPTPSRTRASCPSSTTSSCLPPTSSSSTLALPYVIVRGLLPLRLLLPWWVRADEYVLVSYLQGGGGGGEGLAYTSRLLESGVYRWVMSAVLMARVGAWVHRWGKEWWAAYKAAAFERRWGMQTLRNVEDDEEEEGNEQEEAGEEEKEVEREEGEVELEGEEEKGNVGDGGDEEEGAAFDDSDDDEVADVRRVRDVDGDGDVEEAAEVADDDADDELEESDGRGDSKRPAAQTLRVA